MPIEAEQLAAARDTARRFARREIEPMVGTEGRDGDLAALPGVLQRASAAGLLASSDPEAPGYAYGVWGRSCPEEGDEASLVVLLELAAACAGVAACLHCAGLAALEGAEHSLAGVALLNPETWRPTWASFTTPPPGAATLTDDRLGGACSFVQAPPGAAAYVVYAAGDQGWERVVLPRDAAGLRVEREGQRTGLAALEVVHLTFDDVVIQDPWRLRPANPTAYLRRQMLGLGAIAAGNALGAIAAAERYAAERYQGGGPIEEHPAVQLLIGESRSRAAAARACVMEAARSAELWDALAAKLRVTLACDQAVSDSLQVLGGYGYMEDYRLEKRLRDAMTLKATAPEPNTLRLLCAHDPERRA